MLLDSGKSYTIETVKLQKQLSRGMRFQQNGVSRCEILRLYLMSRYTYTYPNSVQNKS